MNDITTILLTMFKIMDAIKKQRPELYEHLMKVMRFQGIYYNEDTVIYKIGDDVDRACFISEGFITRSAVLKKGKKIVKQVVAIFEKNEIKAGPDFMEQNKSEFQIEAKAGTYVAIITFEQLQKVFELFPEAHGLATLIISRHNLNQDRLKRQFSVKGIELVYQFYKRYPLLTEPGSILLDDEIASFLRISVRILREHRSTLFDTERLINPATLRAKKHSA